jgi:hypothetical protein
MRFLYPIWNAVPSTIQSWLLSDLEQKGRLRLRQLAEAAPNWAEVSRKMESFGFKWSQDPLRGLLDFHQRTWITCARGEGDCDDWAHVWARIAKPFGEVRIFAAKERGGGWHMMSILDDGTNAYLFSNLLCIRTTPSGNKKALETTFYGYDKTKYIVYL